MIIILYIYIFILYTCIREREIYVACIYVYFHFFRLVIKCSNTKQGWNSLQELSEEQNGAEQKLASQLTNRFYFFCRTGSTLKCEDWQISFSLDEFWMSYSCGKNMKKLQFARDIYIYIWQIRMMWTLLRWFFPWREMLPRPSPCGVLKSSFHRVFPVTGWTINNCWRNMASVLMLETWSWVWNGCQRIPRNRMLGLIVKGEGQSSETVF